ncbi:succinate dehydrogenase hydrophobic anchor subunit [Evansella vedderi]|uniref:Succinate dehydrogenase hydrophobic anchor subunit n=1 Tax=Evansella vedderi TaxID=38282 RepID=A0ABU0A3U8_9BACI|nr:hypothetical protein [Evansella vedderi]MDQ0257035.1 succinate dehydrogenase hydrophobic anchor subunit [Evansella vedderi]
MNILIGVSAIICIFALAATIFIGLKPNDKDYVKTTKSRMTLLTLLYIITFVPALIFVIVYFFFR